MKFKWDFLTRPVNLLDSYEDRYTYSFAFAATATSIVKIILDGDYSVVFGKAVRDVQNDLPSWGIGKFFGEYENGKRALMQLICGERV